MLTVRHTQDRLSGSHNEAFWGEQGHSQVIQSGLIEPAQDLQGFDLPRRWNREPRLARQGRLRGAQDLPEALASSAKI